MKHCTNCGTLLLDDVNFCQSCGASQVTQSIQPTHKSTPAIIVTLCVLTIIGSALGIVRGLFYETISHIADQHDYWRGYAFAAVNACTLIAAIMMLYRKKIGLMIYVVFQVAYILLVGYTTFFYSKGGSNSDVENAIGTIGVFIAALFIIPSLILLILFITMARKHLR